MKMSTFITIISQASKDPGASIVGEEVVHHNYGDARSNSNSKSYKKWARVGIMMAVALMIALAIAIGVNNGQKRGDGTPPTLSATQAEPEEVTLPQIIQKDENPQLDVDAPKPAPLPQQQQTLVPTSALTNGATVTVSIETTAPPTISDRSSSDGDRRMIQSPTWNG
jgi:hypothetical protein